jgi:hypothetical protein
MKVKRLWSSAILFATSLSLASPLPGLTSMTTLSQTLQVGPITLPAGTDVSYAQDGAVAEAVIHAPLKYGSETLPSGTKLAFYLDAAYDILPSQPANTASGQLASPMRMELLFSLEDLSQECKSPKASWLGNYDSPQVHAISRIDQLNISKLPLSESPSPYYATTLSSSYQGDDAELPSGTVIQVDGQGNVIGIYFPSAGRLGDLALPQGSIVDRAAYGSYEGIYVHDSVSVGGNDVLPEGFLMLAWDGSLAETTLNAAMNVNAGLTAPSRARVNFMNGHVHRVDVRNGEVVTYFGSQVASGHSICFADSGEANIRIGGDTKIGLSMFPSGSFIIEDPSGQPLLALLSRDSSISGLVVKSTNGQQIDAYFDAAGNISRAILATPATIGGVKVQDEIETQGNGFTLKSGTLVNDQLIDGVPCMGGAPVQLNAAGHPVVFTASSTYQIGGTVLQRGQQFLGTYVKHDVLPIFDGSKGELASAIQQLQAELVSKGSAAVLAMSGHIPFGNMGTVQDHDFSWDAAGSVLHLSQQLHVQNLFTNPGFVDCDGDLKLDATVTWIVVHEFMKQTVVAWPSALTISYKHNFCPGTSVLEAAKAIADLDPHLRELLDSKISGPIAALAQRSVIQKEIGDTALAKYEQIIQLLQTDGTYVPGSLQIDSVLVESGNLNIHYSYSVSVL